MTTFQPSKREFNLICRLVSTYSEIADSQQLRVRAIKRGGSFVTFCVGDCSWTTILLPDYNPSIPDSIIYFDELIEHSKRLEEITFQEKRAKGPFSVHRLGKSDVSYHYNSAEIHRFFEYLAIPLTKKDKPNFSTVEFRQNTGCVTDGFRLQSIILPEKFPSGDYSMTRATFNFVAAMLAEGDGIVLDVDNESGGKQAIRVRSKSGDWQVISRVPMRKFEGRCSMFLRKLEEAEDTSRQCVCVPVKPLRRILSEFLDDINDLFVVELSFSGKRSLRVRAYEDTNLLSTAFVRLDEGVGTVDPAYRVRFNPSYLAQALPVDAFSLSFSFPRYTPGCSWEPTRICTEDRQYATLLMPVNPGRTEK